MQKAKTHRRLSCRLCISFRLRRRHRQHRSLPNHHLRLQDNQLKWLQVEHSQR
jgi:hypothetical protein